MRCHCAAEIYLQLDSKDHPGQSPATTTITTPGGNGMQAIPTRGGGAIVVMAVDLWIVCVGGSHSVSSIRRRIIKTYFIHNIISV